MNFFRDTSWKAPFFILGVVFVVYANSLWNGLTFDDHALVEDNRVIRSLDLGQIFSAPYWYDRFEAGLYRPVTTWTLAVNYAVGRDSPFGYHLVNVLVHGVNACLVYRIARVVLGQVGAAVGVALLFGLHPVQTEAVNGIVGRAELLAAFFMLLSWSFYIRADVGRGRRLGWAYLGALLASFLGMLSKENAASCVGVLFVYDWLCIHQGRWPGGLQGLLKRGLPRYVPFVVVMVVVLVIRQQVLGAMFLSQLPAQSDNPISYFSPLGRFLTTVRAVGTYFRLLVFPWTLSPDYSHGGVPAVGSFADPEGWVPLLSLIGVGFCTVYWIRKRVFLSGALGVLVFSVAFTPVSNFVVTIGTILGERLLYFPTIGFALLLGAGLVKLLDRRVLRWALLGAILLTFAVRTGVRNRDWRDDRTLFEAALVSGYDGAKTHYNLGVAYRKAGERDRAIAAFEQVARLRPWDAKNWLNLGTVYVELERHKEALVAFERAWEQKPDWPQVYVKTGLVHEVLGDLDRAKAAYQTGLDRLPEARDLHYELARLLGRDRNYKEAIWHCLAVLDGNLGHFDAVRLLGALYLDDGQYEKALAVCRMGLGRWPENEILEQMARVAQEKLTEGR